ncbi:MAG TPA: CBS domain-containing protein [Candidatus Bathyarchaeia archaeon]|nr:CBS domain-containing protein [Candidatus Bathyarchaeia archaeon]
MSIIGVEERIASSDLLQLFPWIFQRTSPTVDEDNSLIDEAVILGFRHVDFLPVLRAGKVTGRIHGKEIVKVLREIRDIGFQQSSRMKIDSIIQIRIGLLGVRDSLRLLLDAMLRNGVGHACVVEDQRLVATVSLRDVIRFVTSLNLRTGVRVIDLANPAISLPSNATVSKLLDQMILKNVRRIVVQGDGQKVVDDRGVVEYAFGSEGIMLLKDRPDDFFKLPLRNLSLREVSRIDGEADVAEAWDAILKSPAECLLVDGKIVTPWDLVIRLYSLGRFPTVRQGFDVVVARCFENTLRGLLGETASKAVLLNFETTLALTPLQICSEAERFTEALTQTFGSIGSVVQRSFLRGLYSELKLSLKPNSEFKEALEYAKERYEAIEKPIANANAGGNIRNNR